MCEYLYICCLAVHFEVKPLASLAISVFLPGWYFGPVDSLYRWVLRWSIFHYAFAFWSLFFCIFVRNHYSLRFPNKSLDSSENSNVKLANLCTLHENDTEWTRNWDITLLSFRATFFIHFVILLLVVYGRQSHGRFHRILEIGRRNMDVEETGILR